MRLVFLGPPGAGKGTQASRLAADHGLCQVSTGDILRQAVANGTPMGRKAREFMDAGRLVPDEVVIGIVRDKLAAPECAKGYILDGFPRTSGQARALDDILLDFSAPLDRVAAFVVDENSVVERLSGRRTCSACQAMFHVKFAPPKAGGQCDRCGGTLVQRDDDREEVIRKRLSVYAESTRPLLDYYRQQGLLTEVSAGGAVDVVYAAVKAAVGIR
ncbi:MAG: adenylate kinase [Nitrospirota bacterium]|nr:adenylate kinase [Nitrospirota bacterium]